MVSQYAGMSFELNVAKLYILNTLVRHHVSSEENWLGLGLGSNDKTWFEYQLNSGGSSWKATDPDIFFTFHTVLSQDTEEIRRQIYTVLDLLGDVGGLFDALKAIISVVLSINFMLRGNPVEEFLLGLVFKQDIE